ncbi:hypothetical protein D3C80_2066600 [compost metagenome]
MQVQVTLVTQFVERFFLEHGADFASLAMQDAQVGVGAVQPGVDQIGHGYSPWIAVPMRIILIIKIARGYWQFFAGRCSDPVAGSVRAA